MNAGEGISVSGKEYRLIELLGHGKGGYSYLVQSGKERYVLKQIHHELCDYYQFGNKVEAELNDYKRLKDTGIRIPEMYACDPQAERIIKEFIEGDTVFSLLKRGESVDRYLPQVLEMAKKAYQAGLNIDYFPTNFVLQNECLYYIDYECNTYMSEWSFDNWGIKYWSRTPEFDQYLEEEQRKKTAEEKDEL